MAVKLVVFDMAGTTVNDLVDGVPLVLKSYHEAFTRHGITVPMEILNEQRGRDKRTVINQLGGDQAPQIYQTFIDTLDQNIRYLTEIPGTTETFRYLRSKNIKIALSTGFPSIIASQIVEQLGWEDSIDMWVCSEMVGASRPDPAMILYAMKKSGIHDPQSVVKIDDTAKGVEEGLNAGVITLGVLTGTQSIQRLGSAGPLSILNTIRGLPGFLEERGLV